MQYTIEAILKGNEKIPEYFQNAKGKWQELFGDTKKASAEDWAERVTAEYTGYFDKECGGPFLGSEVMVWSAFGALFSTQFGWQPAEKEIAQKLVKAFAESACPEGVKTEATKAALFYDLGRRDETRR